MKNIINTAKVEQYWLYYKKLNLRTQAPATIYRYEGTIRITLLLIAEKFVAYIVGGIKQLSTAAEHNTAAKKKNNNNK